MPTPTATAAVARYATAFAAAADLSGPYGPAQVAAFWCLTMLRGEPGTRPPGVALAQLSAALGRRASGADLLAVLEMVKPVPAAVAATIRDGLPGALRAG